MMRKRNFGEIVRGFNAIAVAVVLTWSANSAFAQANARAEELYRQTDYWNSLSLLPAATRDAATNNLIGRNYFMMGDFKKAVEYFERAAAAEPGNSDYALWLGRAWGRRAETSNPFAAPGYAGKARVWLEKSVALKDRNGEALSDLFDYYLEAPGFLGGGYEKAQAVSRKISDVDPAEGYFARARLAEKRSQYDTAEEQLRHAVELAPRQVGRVLDLAKFLANQGKQQESDALFAKAATMAPEAPKVWYARADSLIKQKRNLAEAKRLLHRYLDASITPDDPSKDDAQRLLKQVAGS